MKYLPCFLLLFGPSLCAQHISYQDDMAVHRAQYKIHFLSDPRSPLGAADTAMLDFFPINADWVFRAKFERTPDAKPFEMPTYSGQKRDYVQFGVLKFEANGQALSLNVYQNLKLVKDTLYRNHLFLPFKDHTNGESTYGGGRYIDLSQDDILPDNTLFLDFNKCYNPWCAYSDGFNCPIPPAPNHLSIEIPAGERNFKGEKKH
ncbi:MAG: DUF1684 domain-containing protein [Saprospiraceae bacterium]|nr:DUF1684 domain-containing protein [Saprospiraceae bacterium]